MTAIARLSLVVASACSHACLEGVAAMPMGNPAADFFVSPQGKDTWSGKLADPARTTGRLRRWRAPRGRSGVAQGGEAAGRVRVVLRGGTYYLDSPLEFGRRIRELWTRR